MDWLKELIEKHSADGKIDIDAVMNAVKEEFQNTLSLKMSTTSRLKS